MEQLNQMLALVLGAGLVGGFIVGRTVRGRRALIAWPLWLSLPFLVLAVILGAQSDASLTQQQRDYNFGFGLVLISIVIAVPWLPANLIGGLVGLWLRKPAPLAPAAQALPEVVTQDGRPVWRYADSPSLSLGELGAMMQGAAELAGTDPARLPQVGPRPGDGVFLDRDKFDYIYFGRERGEIMFDHRSVIADQLLYWVFIDQAFMLATTRLDARRKAGEAIADRDYAALLAAEQAAILGDVDPAWERQFVHERALRAGG